MGVKVQLRCKNWKGKDKTGIIYNDTIVQISTMTLFVEDLENPCDTLSKDTEVDCEGRLSKFYMVAASTQPWESGYLWGAKQRNWIKGH